MNVLEAIEIIKNAQFMVIKGDKDQAEEAVITLATEACRKKLNSAEWVYVGDTPFFESIYKCSTCGREARSTHLTRYCGNCGCKMNVRSR